MGKLIWLMGPPDPGKDSLLAELRQQGPVQLLVAHRYITCVADAGNENYIALSEQEFFTRARQNLLALSQYVNGFHCGAGMKIDLWLHTGFDVVVNGPRAHLPQAQTRYGTSLLPIYLQVSPAILRQRLQSCERGSETEIAARLECVARYASYDCHVLNNDGSLLQFVDTLLTPMGHKERKHVRL